MNASDRTSNIALPSGRALARSLFAVIAVFFFALAAQAQSPEIKERLGVPGPIAFKDQTFNLRWTSQPSDAYFKQEYLPEGQELESFTSMFLVEAVIGNITPMDSAASQIQMLDQRKGTDPVVNHSVMENKQTGEVLLDFVLSDLNANPVIVEWNAYRYTPLKDQKGVALFAISRRGYGEADAKALLQNLKVTRNQDIQALGTFAAPSLKITADQ